MILIPGVCIGHKGIGDIVITLIDGIRISVYIQCGFCCDFTRILRILDCSIPVWGTLVAELIGEIHIELKLVGYVRREDP